MVANAVFDPCSTDVMKTAEKPNPLANGGQPVFSHWPRVAFRRAERATVGRP
jgi:hypothetical protein